LNKQTKNRKRWPSAIVLVSTYCRSVIDWAKLVGTPTADRLAMAADDKLRKSANLTRPGSTLAEAMGFPGEPLPEADGASVALDVLTRCADALVKLGEDIDPRTVGVGLDAVEKVIGALARATGGSPSIALVGSGRFTDDVDGREHDHFMSPPHPCCADLPRQRPTEWRLHDKRYGEDAHMTVEEIDVLRADYEAARTAITPRSIVRRIKGQAQ
jgi:hypothetical protein